MEFTELKLNKKITTAKINQFAKKGYDNVEKLLRMQPKGYCNYSNESFLSNPLANTRSAFHLKMTSCAKKMGKKKPYVQATCTSLDERYKLNIMWFDVYIYDQINELKNKEVFVAGLLEVQVWNSGKYCHMKNPDFFEEYKEGLFKIYPIYKKIPNMSIDYMLNVLEHSLDEYKGDDYLDAKFKKTFNIIDEDDMFSYLHRPENIEQVQKANYRLSIESLFPFTQTMMEISENSKRTSNIIPKKLDVALKVKDSLPYELTADQKNILNQFFKEARGGKRVNALVQGDVGSGKTICAILLMLILVDNGYQAVLMAPTGILAKQHFEELTKLVEPFGIKTTFLSSDLKKAERDKAIAMIKSGEASMIVGTHSLLSDEVEFNNLGITVIDEEHKFGVEQREILKKKAAEGVHNVSMSATPIPRSLAQTLYGDLMDIYTIESMPKGRLPIKTATVKDMKSAFNFMYKEIANGHQCYIVCPMISNNKDEDEEDEADKEEKRKIYSVEEIAEIANEYFKGTNIKVGTVTGKMKEEEKSEMIKKFENNEYQILIATTIIEVGVNVPNTTVISVMNAERFGLAGLHQLRGRVGRNSLQSYCILYSEDKDNPRLEVMCKTTNGFEIAEEDLKLRGTGDIVGIKQSGEDQNVTLMLKYPKLYNALKDYIRKNLI